MTSHNPTASETQLLAIDLGAPSAAILGNSFAAGAALCTAHDDPARVRVVVLLGPILRDQRVSAVTRFVLTLGFAGPWRVGFRMKYWDSLFTSRNPATHSYGKASLRRNLREPGRLAALRNMVGLTKADTAAILPRTRVPALIVMGSRDPDLPDAAAQANGSPRRSVRTA